MTPSTAVVRPGYVFAGLIMTRQAALRIGIVSLAAPELKWPMKTIASGSLAAVVAFCWATAPSQSPLLAADESSRSVYLMV